MRIRPAVLTDVTRIIQFVKAHEHLLGENDPKVSTGYLRRQLKHALKAKDQAIFITLDNNNKLLGVVVCFLAPYIWSQELYVTDVLLLADQGGNFLINKLEQWGKKRGAKRSTLQTHTCFDQRVEKLYERKGYQRSGAVFEKVFTEGIR